MANIAELEAKLVAARERLQKAAKALAPKHKGREVEEFQAAFQAVKSLERENALAKGLETAVKIDWQPEWNTGASCPHVISSEEKTFLIYLARVIDPHWDGSYVNVIGSKSNEPQPLVLVEFKGCYIYKFGGMNDEVWQGHSLYEKGLEGYSAHRIENSEWLKEQKRINSVHPFYKEEHWSKYNHFMLLFHDTMFECLAESYTVEVHRDFFGNVVKLATAKFFQE